MQRKADMMMEMLVALMEEFASLGQTSEAGPHIHALMGLAHRSGRSACAPAPFSPRREPARLSASKRASASSRP